MKKKVVAAMMSMMVMMLGGTSVLAAEYHDPTTAEVPVTFEKNSGFTVTLPEQISGASGQTSASFVYSVKGDIASDENVTITLDDADASTDGAQVVLKDVLNNEKNATVAIDKESFAYDEITGEGLTENGSATFSGLTAGTWTGNAKFIIGLN